MLQLWIDERYMFPISEVCCSLSCWFVVCLVNLGTVSIKRECRCALSTSFTERLMSVGFSIFKINPYNKSAKTAPVLPVSDLAAAAIFNQCIHLKGYIVEGIALFHTGSTLYWTLWVYSPPVMIITIRPMKFTCT